MPTALTVLVWRVPSLITAAPAGFGTYAVFVYFLFKAPIWLVAGVWLGFAFLLTPLLMQRYPGQYTLWRAIKLNLFIWPVHVLVLLLAEPDESFSKEPDTVPGQLTGTVSFIETAGLEADIIMIFLEEFGETVFYADGSIESRDGLREDSKYRLDVERRRIEELDNEVMYISNPEKLS